MSDDLTPAEAKRRAAQIRALRLPGHGGMCGNAAIEINQRVFAGNGTYVVALNEYLWRRGRHVGHVAVFYRGWLFDTEGLIAQDDLEGWGMLDPEDPDWSLPSEAAAETVALVEMTEPEVRAAFPECPT